MILEQYNMEQKVIIFLIVLLLLKIFAHIFMKIFIDNIKIKNICLEVLDWVRTGFSALWFAFFIMFFVVQAFKIPSGSMENTLLIGDHLLVNKFYYGVRLPVIKFTKKKSDIGKNIKISNNFNIVFMMKRFFIVNDVKKGDKVVFAYPKDTTKDFIKRCIAVEGDKVEIINKKLYINDVEQKEDYAVHKDINIIEKDNYFILKEFRNRDNFGPFIVPKDYFFMLGDNRDNSHDSRFWGPVHKDLIKGKPIFIFFPIKRIRIMKGK